jgi:hypothetical protein
VTNAPFNKRRVFSRALLYKLHTDYMSCTRSHKRFQSAYSFYFHFTFGAQSGPPLAFFCLFIQRTMINSTHSISRDATLSSGRQINLISNLESRARCGSWHKLVAWAIIKKFPRVFRTRIWCARSNALGRFLSKELYVQSVIVAVLSCKKITRWTEEEKCVLTRAPNCRK